MSRAGAYAPERATLIPFWAIRRGIVIVVTSSRPTLGATFTWSSPMTPRTYLILLVGIFNTVLIIHLSTTPLITDERPWYPPTPRLLGVTLDPTSGTLLPGATPLYCAPTGGWGAFEVWRPTAGQIRRLEEDLASFLAYADSLAEHRYWDGHPPFGAYKRQYIGLRSLGEPPIIFVNAFIEDEWLPTSDWRRRLVCVDDGGTGYWHVQYDPIGRRFRRFGFNGTA